MKTDLNGPPLPPASKLWLPLPLAFHFNNMAAHWGLGESRCILGS